MPATPAAAGFVALAMSLSAAPDAPPRHGPLSVSPTELSSLSTTCGTRKGNCEMNAPYPAGSGCECYFDGERVTGRVVQ